MTASNLEWAGGDEPMHVAAVIAAAAGRDPAALAVLAPDRPPLAYRALQDQVSETCRFLRRLGIPRDGRVALALPDGPELAVATLAVKAAAIACPLYADAPAAELARGLRELRARAVIVPAGTESPAGDEAARLGLQVIELSANAGQPAGTFTLQAPAGFQGPAAAETPPLSSDLAIIMQTSGTTGRPKLVPLTHRNICSGAIGRRDAFHLTAGDRCLALTAMAHILQITNFLAVVLSGGSTVCFPRFNVNEFYRWLAEFRPTWISTVPTILLALLERAPEHEAVIAANLIRFLRCGGAQLTQALAEEAERVFRAPIVDGYGLTETSPTLANTPLPPAVRKPGSVGVAVGCKIAIVDEQLAPLPPHLVGEIVVRGPNVMSGYLDDPEDNAATFTPDGWLRTGDLGYLDEAGYLFVTGRIKEMINRGGQTVSPIEVEAVLRSHPDVAEAAVFALPDDRLGEAVAAAVIPRAGATIEPRALETFAGRSLTWYKVPRPIVVVDQFPLGRTGKVRRVSLAHDLGLAPGNGATERTRRFIAPATPVERFVAGVWAEVLAGPAIGVDDHLLTLGGDSLGAARIAARLRAELGVELHAANLLAGRTVGEIAIAIESMFADGPATRAKDPARRAGRRGRAARDRSRTGEGDLAPTPPPLSAERLDRQIRKHQRQQRRAGTALPVLDREVGALPLSVAQERIWSQLAAGSIHSEFQEPFTQPVAIRIRGPLKLPALKRALDIIGQRHETLRTTFATGGGVTRPVIHPEIEVPLAVTRRGNRGLDDSRDSFARYLETRGLQEARWPFDLERGPLLRGRLLELDDEDHALLLVGHRLIIDAWSTGILLRELRQLYGLGPGPRRNLLPAPSAQYVDFAAWQRRWLAGDQAGHHLDYWRRHLAGLPPLALPTTRARPEGRSHYGATIGRTGPAPTTAGLRSLARREQATLAMTLLAALQSLLATTTGQPEFGIGTPVPGRGHPATEAMIGAFATTIVMRADLTGDPTFRATLARARRTALEAYRHQDLPYEQVEAALAAERGGAPVYEVALTMNHTRPDVPEDGEVSFERLALDTDQAPVELTFGVTEHEHDLRLTLTYAVELFAPDAMTALLEQFGQVLTAVTANPELRLSELPAAAGWASGQPALGVTAPSGPAPRTAAGVAAREPAWTPTEAAVAAAWRRVLDLDDIGRDEDFFDLGGHSLLLAQVGANLQETLEREIPPALFFSAPTIARLAAEIDALRPEAEPAAPASMIALQPAGERRPLYFVPGGIGDGSRLFRFAKLAREIGPDRPFFGFFAAEVDETADPQQWVEATAAGYVRQIRAHQPNGPYLLFGACLGGFLVYEMARQMTAAGERVPHLILIDTRHPDMPATREPSRVRLDRHQQRQVRRRQRKQDKRGTDQGERTATPIESAMSAIAEDLEFESGVAALQSPRVRHLKRYRPGPYPGRITLFANSEWYHESSSLGWDRETAPALDVRPLPGQHGSFVRDHTGDLAAIIRDLLAEIEASSAAGTL